jgi:hypothetical protein
VRDPHRRVVGHGARIGDCRRSRLAGRGYRRVRPRPASP